MDMGNTDASTEHPVDNYTPEYAKSHGKQGNVTREACVGTDTIKERDQVNLEPGATMGLLGGSAREHPGG